jgi:hypothetical protein
MAVKVVGGIVSVLALCFAIPSLSLAEHDYEITVTIGDTTLNSSSPHTSVPIAGSYSHAATGGSITITNVGTGGATAKVELTAGMTDGVEDSIRLINARITANNTSVNNFPITFKRRMTSGPDTPPALYYKMYTKGLFQQALGSSIYLGWFGKNPLSNGFFFLDSKQYTPGATSFTIAPAGKAWPTPPEMIGDRVPKVEFTIKLANGKYLDFETVAQSRMIKIYSSPSADHNAECAGTDPDCIVQDEPTLYIPYQYAASEVVGVRGWWCRVFGIGCPD